MEKQFMGSVERLSVLINEMEWEKADVYAFWLRQTLAFVDHTTRLICLAAARTPLTEPEGHREWIQHLREETNHDVVVARDLKSLGYEKENMPVFWSVEQMVQNQYFYLASEHPIVLRGYSLFLEGLACQLGPNLVARLEKTYHRNQLNFIRLHAMEDQDHFVEGVRYLSQIPNLPVEILGKNLDLTESLYTLMIKEALRIGHATARPKAA